MSLIIMLSGIVPCFICSRLHFKTVQKVLVTVLLLFTALIAFGLAPQYLLNRLQRDFAEKPVVDWHDSNVIVLLGAGSIAVGDTVEPGFFGYSRITETARLYYDCRKLPDHYQWR